MSLQICTKINCIMKNKLLCCSIRFVFQTKCKISNFFTFKDNSIILIFWHSFQISVWWLQYYLYGKAKHYFKVRMCEHLGISALTGKRVKDDDESAIKVHLLFCNLARDFEDFSILATNNNDLKLKLMENFLFNRNHPPLNKNKQS